MKNKIHVIYSHVKPRDKGVQTQNIHYGLRPVMDKEDEKSFFEVMEYCSC